MHTCVLAHQIRFIALASLVLAGTSCTKTVQLKEGAKSGGVVSGPEAEVDRTVQAVWHANTIFKDARFWELVAERSWLSSATRIIAGKEVAEALRSTSPLNMELEVGIVWSCWSFVPFWNGTCNASTSNCTRKHPTCGVIAVNDDYVEDATEEYLVNTVAHETTHVFGCGSGLCGCEGSDGFLFSDPQPRSESHEAWLVSYGVGDLAQCFHQSEGDTARTRACFARIVNGNSCDRTTVECCRSASEGNAANILSQIRRQSKWCEASVRCPDPKQVGCKQLAAVSQRR